MCFPPWYKKHISGGQFKLIGRLGLLIDLRAIEYDRMLDRRTPHAPPFAPMKLNDKHVVRIPMLVEGAA